MRPRLPPLFLPHHPAAWAALVWCCEYVSGSGGMVWRVDRRPCSGTGDMQGRPYLPPQVAQSGEDLKRVACIAKMKIKLEQTVKETIKICDKCNPYLGTMRRCIGIVDMGTRARNVPKLMPRTADMYDRWRLSTRASSNSGVAHSSCGIPV